MPSHKLYSGTKNASSWAMRAWLALREAGVEFEEDVVDIRRPQRFANLAAIGAMAPPAAIPVLVAGGRVIFDSLAIMEYANDRCDGMLLPDDPLDRAEARAMLAWQHSGLSQIGHRVSFESAFYPEQRALTADEVRECARLQRHVEALLFRSEGPFLFGALSLADLALAPTVIRLTRHRLDFSAWPLSGRWCETLLSRPSIAEWMEEAQTLPHIWFEDYLPQPEAVSPAGTAW